MKIADACERRERRLSDKTAQVPGLYVASVGGPNSNDDIKLHLTLESDAELIAVVELLETLRSTTTQAE